MTRRALAAALLALLAVPAAGMAASPLLRFADGRIPSAQIQVTGDGTMTFSGRMAVNGTIPPHGAVTVLDRGGDAQAFLAGQPLRMGARGRADVRNASGILFVVGSNVVVRIEGQGLTFAGAGNGRARFAGTGTYRLNGGDSQPWTTAWVRVAPPRQARRGDT